MQWPRAGKHSFLKSFYFNTRQNHILAFRIWGVILTLKNSLNKTLVQNFRYKQTLDSGLDY